MALFARGRGCGSCLRDEETHGANASTRAKMCQENSFPTYHVTRYFTLQLLYLPETNFGIALHSIYCKSFSAEIVLLYITLSWPQPLSCTSFLFTHVRRKMPFWGCTPRKSSKINHESIAYLQGYSFHRIIWRKAATRVKYYIVENNRKSSLDNFQKHTVWPEMFTLQ